MFGFWINPTPGPHWCYSLPAPFPPMFFSPVLFYALEALSPLNRERKEYWHDNGLAVDVDEVQRRGSVLKRMKETFDSVRCEKRRRVKDGLKIITLTCFSCKVMVTVVGCLPSHLPLDKCV